MCGDLDLGNKILKKCKEVITMEINVVVTFVVLRRRVVNRDKTHRTSRVAGRVLKECFPIIM